MLWRTRPPEAIGFATEANRNRSPALLVISFSLDLLQKCLKCHVERSRSVPEA
ncbi:MAG: hypothetical protein KME57_26195 [Scytonema hyalinum WJT4-NPBG1]|nr:hypothetical protein [Scytonema hyalinum WJT4-NPBG1]